MSEEWKRCPFLCEMRDLEIDGTSKVIGYICKGQCQGCQARRPAEDALKAEVERMKDKCERFRKVLHDVAVMANEDDLEQIFEKCRDVLRDVYLEEKFQKRFSEILHGSATAEKGGEDE